MTFLQDLLYVCVLLLVGPSFYKSVDCALIVTPENVAAISAENVTLRCASDRKAKNSIVWGAINLGSTITHIIYTSVLSQNVSSYIYVDNSDDGSCNLTITASNIAAKRYICIESSTGSEASAELIVLERNTKCNLKLRDREDCTVTIMSTGNWAPVVDCDQWDNDKKYNRLNGSKSEKADNNAVASSWVYSIGQHSTINCSAMFLTTGKPQQSTATNIPTRVDLKVAPSSERPPSSTGWNWTDIIWRVVLISAICVIIVIAGVACLKRFLWNPSRTLVDLEDNLESEKRVLAKRDERNGSTEMESDKMTDMMLTPIQNVKFLKSLDQIRYPAAEASDENFTNALVTRVFDDTTVEVLKLPTTPTDNTGKTQLKSSKSFPVKRYGTSAYEKCNVDLRKFAQEKRLIRVDYDKEAFLYGRRS